MVIVELWPLKMAEAILSVTMTGFVGILPQSVTVAVLFCFGTVVIGRVRAVDVKGLNSNYFIGTEKCDETFWY